MKLASVLLATVAALSAVYVDANGVCYDPDHTTSKSASTVAEDMALIKSKGFDAVRTYISYFGSTEMGPIITAAGLTAALGVPYPNSDYSSQATAAISAANSGGVAYIFVGNENLAGASSVPSAMIDLISSIKSQVPDSVKVGTVQRNTEVINYSSISGWSDLVSACDVLGVNVHPFFTGGTSADDAMALVQTQWNTMYSNFGSKLLLTETGWPTGGSYSGNSGSVSGLETFYSDYQSWMSSQSQSFFFQMYDTPSKSEDYEKVFGLLTYDSQDKFTLASSPTSSPSTTSPATTTPEPTTATPEPTTATPEPTTATPEPTTSTPEPTATPEAESSASSDVALEADAASEGSDSTSLRGSVGSGSVGSSSTAGSVGSGSTDAETGFGSDDEVADEADVGEGNVSSESTTTGTAGTSGTSGDAQKTTGADNSGSSETANTQSTNGSSSTVVGLAIAGAGCAAMVAFGFIYQTRKRAQELEDLDDKRDDDFPSAVTPVENINVL